MNFLVNPPGMRIGKALQHLRLARTGKEAERLVRQGSVKVGGCLDFCSTPRRAPYRCICWGWRKVTNPVEIVGEGEIVCVGNGNWRLLPRLDGEHGFDQVAGIKKLILG